MSQNLIHTYYEAFNKKNWETFFDLLDEHVVHDINQGNQEVGKNLFMHFMERMNRSYDERVVDLIVLTGKHEERAAAEFFIEGVYLATDPGLPPARNQKYRLRCGAFFEIRKEKICRVTNYYNLKEWLSQVQ